MSHIERRQKEKEETRKRIVNTALQIVINEGWDAVTIRKIAEAIEYTPPIVYEYFKNKNALLCELVKQGNNMLFEGFHNITKKETEPKKVLRLLSLNHWEFAKDYPKLYYFTHSFKDYSDKEEIQAISNRLKGFFIQITGDEEFALELMYHWMCLQQGFIFSMMLNKIPPSLQSKDPKEMFIKAIDRFLSSF